MSASSSQAAKFPLALYFVYEALWHVLIPFVLLRLLWRSRKNSDYLKHVRERFGFYGTKPSLRKAVWIHAVSVGETRATQALVESLLKEGQSILLTHMTPTGRKTGAELYRKAIASGQLQQAYLPYDICWAIEAFLKHYRPQLGLFMETEAWPGFVFRTKQLGVPLFLINARLSGRSFKRVQLFGSAGRSLFQSFVGILAQSEPDAKRYQALGVNDVIVTGNMKFDVPEKAANQSLGKQWKRALREQERLVVCAASTRAGEELIMIDAWKKLLSEFGSKIKPLLIVVPRHPERFTEVANLLYQSTLSFERRSNLSDPRSSAEFASVPHWTNVDVLLGDSMGEMGAYYNATDLVVMGGSLLPTGGQNLIEACANGCPVILGEHTYNFQQASEDAIACGAAVRIPAILPHELAQSLSETIKNLLTNTVQREIMSAKALEYASVHQGATQRILDRLRPVLQS
ncbi:MAG: 3-deoxy-D-manno-octulosonic acid transferase [Limnohabitans sp.]|nr:3-deoxy-D-manno-octulosonic acid transferase [Limnohabitans sp.]